MIRTTRTAVHGNAPQKQETLTSAIPRGLIRTDGGTQMRAELVQDVYFDYRDKWLTGVEFDPSDVFFDGVKYWLADGFHRFYGAREAKLESLPCRVHQGTQRDAVLFATGANKAHGLRRTNADKRLAVETLLNDPEWVLWPDVKIAEQAAVSQPFVSEVRRQLITVISSPAAMTADQPREGRDGKKRKPRRKKSTPPKMREPREDPPEPVETVDDKPAAIRKRRKPVHGYRLVETLEETSGIVRRHHGVYLNIDQIRDVQKFLNKTGGRLREMITANRKRHGIVTSQIPGRVGRIEDVVHHTLSISDAEHHGEIASVLRDLADEITGGDSQTDSAPTLGVVG